MFDIPLPIYFFTKEDPLKTWIKKHIPLLINQFVSLIELKMYLLINYWSNTCKYKICQMTYSKSYSRTPYDVSENKPLLYPGFLDSKYFRVASILEVTKDEIKIRKMFHVRWVFLFCFCFLFRFSNFSVDFVTPSGNLPLFIWKLLFFKALVGTSIIEFISCSTRVVQLHRQIDHKQITSDLLFSKYQEKPVNDTVIA